MKESEEFFNDVLEKADANDVDAMLIAVHKWDKNDYDAEKHPEFEDKINIYLERLANKGYIEHMMLLAWKYKSGLGIEKNREKALTLFESVAEKGYTVGYEEIGLIHYEGDLVAADYEKAFEYFSKATDKKLPSTFYAIAEMYRLGLGLEIDEEKAIKFYEEIILSKNPFFRSSDYFPRACFRRGQLLHKADKDNPEALKVALQMVEWAEPPLPNKYKDIFPFDITENEYKSEWESLCLTLFETTDKEKVKRIRGIYNNYTLHSTMPSDTFFNNVVKEILDLSVHENQVSDYICFNLHFPQKENVVFIQVSPDNKVNYELEIARLVDGVSDSEATYEDDKGRKYKLYRHPNANSKDVIEAFRLVVVDDSCPDLTNWEDITEQAQKTTKQSRETKLDK